MNYSNLFVSIYCIGIGFTVCLNQWLEYIDYRNRVRHGTEIPPELTGLMNAEDLERTGTYENAKYFLWIPQHLVTTVFDVFLLFSGFYPWIFESVWNRFGNVYLAAVLFFLLASLPGAIVSLPFSLFREFRIEKKFGFSTMTFRLWVLDQLKGLVVGGIMTGLLLIVMVAVLEHAAAWWWLLLGFVYILFSFGISFLYPYVIAPLFNKFTAVEDGALMTGITELMKKTGFKAEGVYVMDASKRSTHSNAYFTGFGKSKRIVLFDTLVNQLSVPEIEAVLGHELGHYKRHHIIKRMAVTIPLVFLTLFIISLFVSSPDMYQAFGFRTNPGVFPHMKFIGLFLVMTVFSGYSDIFAGIANWFSRRDEFEADRYSAAVCGSGEPLSDALVKLNKNNLSEIMPPPVYCLFNYSHPPLLERIRALKK